MRRAVRNPVASLLALALLCAALVAVTLYQSWTGVPAVPRVTAASDTALVRLTWIGDVMLGDQAQPLLEEHGYEWPFEYVRHLLDGDLVIANAESVISDLSEPYDPSQHWHYNSRPPAAQAYASVGIDVLGLANNHAMDRGPDGLADMIQHAAPAGMETFGAGMSISEAELPLLVDTPSGTIGIVGLGKYYGRHKMANADQAGTIALSRAAIQRGHEIARRAGADWVVGYVHWGRAYADVTEEQGAFANEFAAAGYDLVIGHHPHVVHPIDFVDGMPVLYSLGNFVFGTPGRFNPQLPGFGLVVTTEFEPSGLTGLTVRCLVTDNEIVDFAPRPCSAREAATVLGALHPDMVVQGETGHLSLPRR